MFEGDDKLYIMYLTIMDQLSKTMPKSFIPHLQTVMQDDMETQPHAKIQLFTLLKNVAIKSEDQVPLFLPLHIAIHFITKLWGYN